ncbi:MAG TPA: S8 family serine peptidase [Anaerolineae bacterium]|nr:S8 family serine peptidase [Anaerolineae bacterium]
MKKLAWLLFPLTVLLAMVLSQTPRGVAQRIDRAEDNPKIDRWVIDRTADNQQAEFLVVLADRADLSGADRLTTKAAKGRYVYETLFTHAQVTQRPIIAWLQQHDVEYRSFYIVNAIWVKADRETALALAARSDVARLDGNPQIYNDLVQPEKSIGPQPERVASIEPGIQYVNAPQVWDLGFTGQGIVIGGQDTGYLWNHPALEAHYRGWDGITATHDYNWHDSVHVTTHGSSCGVDSPAPCDDYGHGTHTMGTLVGDDGGSNQIGMAPGAKWIGCRNMDVGWGSPSTYLECFEFFLAPYPVNGTPAQGDPSQAPDVTSNSWSCPPVEGCNAASLLEAVQVQRAAGIMTVVSATNYGSSSCSTISEPPAIYGEAYTVGALNTGSDTIAGFSSVGPVTIDGSNRRKPDIAAPGTSIRSSTRDGGYGYMGGTSMAAPHVAGAVALLWSAHPAYRNEITLTEQLLNQSAVHISSTACGSSDWPNNTFGYGRLDVAAAVNAVITATQTAQQGDVVTYTWLITNTASTTDTLTMLSGSPQWPTTISPTLMQDVPPAQSFTVTVLVSIPLTAAPNEINDLAVAAASSLTQTAWSFAAFSTRVAPDYGVSLLPTQSSQAIASERTATYTLSLINTGQLTNRYQLTGTLSQWPFSIDPISVTLTAQLSVPVQVLVTAPLTATYPTSDTLRVTVAGTRTLTNSDLISTIALRQIFLPIILR